MDDWRRLERLCLSAGGPEALAFKMARDAMLSPSYSAEARPIASEAICDLPTSDPALNRIRDSLDGANRFALQNVACTMRTLVDPFHNARCGDFDFEEEGGRREYPVGSVPGVLNGRTHVVVTPPMEGCEGDRMDVSDPRCGLKVIHGAGRLEFHDKSVAMDPTFLKINSVICPALKQELDDYRG